MSESVDTLIVGAGLAGLTLAVHFVERGVGGRILLVDPRTDYTWDRTWCFWPVLEHPFGAAVSHRWPRWRVSGAGRSVVSNATALPYCHIASTDLYALARERLATSGRVRLALGVGVESLVTDGDRVVASTTAGRVEAPLAFDARGVSQSAPSDASEVTLCQHFGGLVVEVDEPVFDPDEVTLMDFEVAQRGAVHFMYVLPFAPTRALVEDTWMAPTTPPDPGYDDAVAAYLERRFGVRSFTSVGREQGVIAMTTRVPERRRDRVFAVGLRGGLAKPSSGYAFLAIQRDSARLGAALAGWTGGHLPKRALPATPPPRAARTLALDRIFLAYLARHPERAPELFLGLFERVEPDALVRFLSEAGDWRDDLRVMRALPAGPLMAEAWRSRRLWWGGLA